MAGLGRARLGANRTVRLKDNPSSHSPKHRINVAGTISQKHEQAKSYVNRRTKPAVDSRSITDLSPVYHRFITMTRSQWTDPYLATCSSHLMKQLFAERLSRPDVTVAITRLASKIFDMENVSRSCSQEVSAVRRHAAEPPAPEHALHRDLGDAQLVMSPNADLASDLEIAQPTTDMFLKLRLREGERP